MVHWKRSLAVLGFFSLFALSCATAPAGSGPRPAWLQQPVRTVEGGYIIYVGTGEDATVERSRFKAAGMAIQDLVNECSLAPKGTRTEDSYEQVAEVTRLHKTWVKVSVQYEDCEVAKKAVDPAEIRKIANAQLADELKRYQQMVDEPAPEALAASGDSGVPGVGVPGPNGELGKPSGEVAGVNSFFWTRQRVAYSKQIVILSPPQQYQAGSAQTTAFVQSVAPAQASVAQYEAKNPEVRTWHQSYSASPVRQERFQQQQALRAQVAHQYSSPRKFEKQRTQGGGGQRLPGRRRRPRKQR